jgi:hypothetical protein
VQQHPGSQLLLLVAAALTAFFTAFLAAFLAAFPYRFLHTTHRGPISKNGTTGANNYPLKGGKYNNWVSRDESVHQF